MPTVKSISSGVTILPHQRVRIITPPFSRHADLRVVIDGNALDWNVHSITFVNGYIEVKVEYVGSNTNGAPFIGALVAPD